MSTNLIFIIICCIVRALKTFYTKTNLKIQALVECKIISDFISILTMSKTNSKLFVSFYSNLNL